VGEERVNADAKVAVIAARQHGVVTVTQLRAAGIRRSAVSRRVAAGRLHRIHRGVYAVGHRGLSQEGKWMATVLACGDGAVLSHRSAAELWELLPLAQGAIHVTVPASCGGRSQRRALRIHRSSLPSKDTTVRSGIPITTPARTIAELKRTVPTTTARKAIREAEFRGLDLGDADTDHTRSELERAFLRLSRLYHLPEPEVNVRVAGFTVDFLWRAERLAVETDGYRAHRGRQAFEVAKGRANCRGDPRRLAVNLAVREPAQPDSEHPERKLTLAVVRS
jgi:predicted transcriptional regulator of viral defense system